MKETILEETVRSVLQLIANGGTDSVRLKKIDGTIDAIHYYGVASYAHSSAFEALERCNTAFHQICGELDGIGFSAPAEIRFNINRIAFWREVDKWLQGIGVAENGELADLTEDNLIELGMTIGELAKAHAWKRLIA